MINKVLINILMNKYFYSDYFLRLHSRNWIFWPEILKFRDAI